MTVESLLTRAQKLGATFVPHVGGKLKVQAAAPLPADLMTQLRQHKTEICHYLLTDPQQAVRETETVTATAEPEFKDDPILTPEHWFAVFRACILQYHREHPDHDRLWLKEHHHDLYRRIVAQENAIDALRTVRLSELMGHLREWRSLMLQAEFATADDVRELFGGEIQDRDE